MRLSFGVTVLRWNRFQAQSSSSVRSAGGSVGPLPLDLALVPPVPPVAPPVLLRGAQPPRPRPPWWLPAAPPLLALAPELLGKCHARKKKWRKMATRCNCKHQWQQLGAGGLASNCKSRQQLVHPSNPASYITGATSYLTGATSYLTGATSYLTSYLTCATSCQQLPMVTWPVTSNTTTVTASHHSSYHQVIQEVSGGNCRCFR